MIQYLYLESYNNLRNKKNNELNQKKIRAQGQLINLLTPLLAEYSKEKSISYIIPKKNIIIGKTELDLTKIIIVLLNDKIQKIELK